MARFANLTYYRELLRFAAECREFDYFLPINVINIIAQSTQDINVHLSVVCGGHPGQDRTEMLHDGSVFQTVKLILLSSVECKLTDQRSF